MLLEASSMEKPIVTTNVGIASSIIQDYYNGFILPTKCTEKEFLTKTIEALKIYKRLDNSRTKYFFTWNHYAESVFQSYVSLMKLE